MIFVNLFLATTLLGLFLLVLGAFVPERRGSWLMTIGALIAFASIGLMAGAGMVMAFVRFAKEVSTYF